MVEKDGNIWLEQLRQKYPDKFAGESQIFNKIHPGNRIFIGTACAEPQYLVNALVSYVESNPKAFFDAEVLQVWTLGVAAYTQEKFKSNFRHNSFFIGDNTRSAVNEGLADYTPIFLSQVPALFRKGVVEVDVALVQTSLPDRHGFVSLGVSVDIVAEAINQAELVIAQINSQMPRVQGDGFLNIDRIDYIVPYDEPILEFNVPVDDEIANRIGSYVARLIQDGDTIQVGYGSRLNSILRCLKTKKDLGVHTELMSDAIAELMQYGVINNSKKVLDRGKTVATFCMGKKETYDYIDDNPAIEFRTIDYTNDPIIISQHDNMVAINSALEIDLTGQATSESLGRTFYSGVGGQADFMRGAILSHNGRTILTIQSTAQHESVSRIMPYLKEGSGVTMVRGDIHYVVSEYGIAYLHGKNIRERAMELIAIAHPKFRPWLIEEAKKLNIIYRDQAFVPGKRGEYPESIEVNRTTMKGLQLLLRPVRINDEPLIKDFFYSLSDQSLYRRFISSRRDMPHERLQEFVVIDYTQELVILATVGKEENEEVVGVGQYGIGQDIHSAEVAFAVRDKAQRKGIGTELLDYLIYLGKRNGLLSFDAEVLYENKPMLSVFDRAGFQIVSSGAGVYYLKLAL
ncbi:MAG: GNAT family N-acetyltransferase [Dehalococcoidia bacterium]|nr:GNAT family N-acetyltransferase [Dehalococcoidia bacterium]